MGTYNSAVITTAGQSLLARAIADNLPFYFTSAKTTEYVVSTGTSATSLTELPNIKQSEEITSATVSGGNQVATSVRFDNTEITLNYSINTIGVYARVGTDTEETLLAVITAITADVMPSYSAANPVSYVYSINLAISNASNINIVVSPTGTVNVAEFAASVAQIDQNTADISLVKSHLSDIDTALIDTLNENIMPLYLLFTWQRGRLDPSDGQIKAAGYRISTINIQEFDFPVTISCTSGYRMFFAFYDSENTYTTNTGFVTTPYTIPAGQKFRMTIALVTESSSIIADIHDFASNAFITNYTDAEIKKIKTFLQNPQRCGLVQNPGTIVYASDCTITGTNVEVIDSKKTKFSHTSKLIRIKKLTGVTNYSVNMQLPSGVSADHFFITFWMCPKSMDTSKGSYFNVRINGLGNNVQHNNGVSIANNWNYLPVNFTTAQNVTSVQLIFTIRNDVDDGDLCGEYWIDSIMLGYRMMPTFILNFDQWWQESVDNGGYQYCFDNNIPFTLMTKNYDALSDTFIALAKEAESVYGCENSYYASYGANNSSLLNASTYDIAKSQVDAMKNDFVTTFGHDFISFGCTQMKLNYIDRTALLNGGIKMVRGGAAVQINYFDAEDYWTPSIGISSDTLTLAQVKTLIDQCIKNGTCIIAFTHGVCADNATVMDGSTSNGMKLTDFKDMVDYLVSLRNQGKIQICTMEDWYHQCVRDFITFTE